MKVFKDTNLCSRDYLLVRLDALMGVEPGTAPLKKNMLSLSLGTSLGDKFLQVVACQGLSLVGTVSD